MGHRNKDTFESTPQARALTEQVALHSTTFTQKQLNDNTLDDNLSQFSFQPSQSLESPQYDAGVLDTLPLELLHLVMAKLDLRSLTNFRYVNRRTAELVDSQPQYRVVARYARSSIRGVLSIQTGAWITCETLYDKLATPECEACGDFAGYLYLITCRRVCFLCLSEDESYLPLGLDTARRRYGLRREQIEKLPCMTIVLGTYSPGESTLSKPYVLYDYDSIVSAAALHHGSLEAANRHMSDSQAQMDEEHRLKCQSAIDQGLRAPRLPPKLFPHDGRSRNPRRFATVVPTPYLDRRSMRLETGFHCAACKSNTRRPLHWRRLFTSTSFAIHLRDCGSITRGKHVLRNHNLT
nr:hypothetical protein CFP56_28760 [Quercus suber]